MTFRSLQKITKHKLEKSNENYKKQVNDILQLKSQTSLQNLKERKHKHYQFDQTMNLRYNQELDCIQNTQQFSDFQTEQKVAKEKVSEEQIKIKSFVKEMLQNKKMNNMEDIECFIKELDVIQIQR